ncbi:39S ribosomal protein L21, mitochondrial [Trichonephila inaurata madagascariensis]|uniref:Large ribosomal subunit protein bL21m n=1 Tax=Trichonephila inaurata madagascariensis TaxID=2747483 RepID=A0A8X6Y046_9ARAC|nr:39S ribosomal protein L21, mitochondrial [Trichonephila inaurata madagascariensis]
MNVVRRFSFNCFKTFSRQASAVLFKEPQLQSVCFTRTISSRKNSNFASSASLNPNTNSDNDFETDEAITDDVLSKINTQIKENSHGRLFAVIQLCEKRFKITAEDIIAIGSYFPANVGDRICLEKVLLVGSTGFTLLGRPLLHKDLVRVEATIIEKTFIVPRPLYRHGRLRYRRLHWFRTPYTLFRINSIEFKHSLDDLPEVEGIQGRVIY